MERITKQFIAFILSLLMLLATWSFAAAETTYDLSSMVNPTAALDLVILLDDSGSMSKQSKGNDIPSFRYDAASIMLNMCEEEGTKAAVFRFNNAVKAIGSNELTSIDMNGRVRKKLTTELDERVRATAGKNYGGPTYLGAALQKAVEVLNHGAAERTETGRAPVILILADGTADDTDVLEEAKNECIKQGYKVYTVLLMKAFDGSPDNLRDLAEQTGGKFFEPTDASELPQMFAQVFADQTGAELTFDKKAPERVAGTQNTWEIKIPVPNRSVKECNIMLPVQGLSHIRLERPDGSVVNADEDNDNVYYYQAGFQTNARGEVPHDSTEPRFIQYKIIRPTQDNTDLGIWKMTFDAEDASRGANVSITVVFNYNLTLKTNYEEDSNEIVAKKGDRFPLVAQFYEENGRTSNDNMLYRAWDEENKSGIVCRAYLFIDKADFSKLNANTPSVVLEPDGDLLQFSKDINLKDFQIDKGSIRSDKDYYLLIKAEGDGLVRTAEPIHLRIENQSPKVIGSSNTIVLSIEDQTKDPNDPVKTDISIDQYLTDPDGEDDIKNVQFELSDSSVASYEADIQDKAHATVTLTAKNQEGNTSLKVTMVDAEDQPVDIQIPIRVESILNALKAEYTVSVETKAPEAGEGKTFRKGEVSELSVHISRKEDASSVYTIENYAPQIDLYEIKENNQSELIKAGLTDNGSHEITLIGHDDGIYRYQAVLRANDKVLAQSDTVQLFTGNMNPKIADDSVWENSAEIHCEKIPDKWLGYENTEPWTISFKDMIVDPNGDMLTFSYTCEPEQQKAVKIEEITEDDRLIGIKVIPEAEGNIEIKVRAVDDYSVSAPGVLDQSYTVSITDRHAITMKYLYIALAALVALIILILIIRAVTRPKFKDVMLDVTVNNVPQKQYPLTADIKKRLMSSYVPANNSFTPAMGAALEIRPARDGAYVILKKQNLLQGAKVSMNGKLMGKSRKKAILRRNNGELKAEMGGQTMVWKLKTNKAVPAMKTASKSPVGGQNRSSTPSYH